MSNLENMQNKIMAEAKKEAEAILEQAERETAAELEVVRQRTQEEVKRQLSYARDKASGMKEHIAASARLEARDTLLRAQQDLIDEVLDEAKTQLLNMSDRDLLALIKEFLAQHEWQEGDVLLLPEGRKLALDPQYKVENDPEIQAGFALRHGGISEKYDYIEMLEIQRTALEQDILKLMQKA